MTPHLSTGHGGEKIPLIPFVDHILREAASTAPSVLHVTRPQNEASDIQWRVFSAKKYGLQPAILATMDGTLFRSALAYLSGSVVNIPPYTGARQFQFKSEDRTYQCVGMVQNTPGCTWVSISFIDCSSQQACGGSA